MNRGERAITEALILYYRAYWFIFVLSLHVGVTWRFWQTLRQSRGSGWQESIAAGGHLMLCRALKSKPNMTIPTYDPYQQEIRLSFAGASHE